MNNVTLIGRITKKPELNFTANQTAVTHFSIAIDRPKKNGEDAGADFPNIVVFGKQAENVCRYKDKGDMIAIQGKIQTGSYKHRDGYTVYTTDVVAERVEFIGSRVERHDEQQTSFETMPEGIPF
jgi:single-strand DNA-binding protein